MTLKEARRQAIALAKTVEDSVDVIAVWRISPRVFQFEIGYGPHGSDTVMLIHVSWAKEGWYDKYHPEWVSADTIS